MSAADIDFEAETQKIRNQMKRYGRMSTAEAFDRMDADNQELVVARQCVQDLVAENDRLRNQLVSAQRALTQIEQIAEGAGIDKLELLNSLAGIRNVVKKFTFTDEIHQSAPALNGSLPSGESDPSVTLDWAGADT